MGIISRLKKIYKHLFILSIFVLVSCTSAALKHYRDQSTQTLQLHQKMISQFQTWDLQHQLQILNFLNTDLKTLSKELQLYRSHRKSLSDTILQTDAQILQEQQQITDPTTSIASSTMDQIYLQVQTLSQQISQFMSTEDSHINSLKK